MADGGFSAGEENPEKIKKSREKIQVAEIDEIINPMLAVFKSISLNVIPQFGGIQPFFPDLD